MAVANRVISSVGSSVLRCLSRCSNVDADSPLSFQHFRLNSKRRLQCQSREGQKDPAPDDHRRTEELCRRQSYQATPARCFVRLAEEPVITCAVDGGLLVGQPSAPPTRGEVSRRGAGVGLVLASPWLTVTFKCVTDAEIFRSLAGWPCRQHKT